MPKVTASFGNLAFLSLKCNCRLQVSKTLARARSTDDLGVFTGMISPLPTSQKSEQNVQGQVLLRQSQAFSAYSPKYQNP